MIYFTDEELDRLIAEDVPYFDITTRLAKFGSQLAKIQFFTKEPTVICCTEETLRFFTKFGITPTLVSMSGEYIEKEVKFLEAEGLAKHLHLIWRTSTNLMEYASGVATRTRFMVEAAKSVNKNIIISSTRKTIPFTRKIAAKAVLAGGGNLNRLSLSENIVLFPNHYKFFGGLNGLISKIDKMKEEAAGKIITVEVKSASEALALSKTSVDVIQLDNLTPVEIKKLIEDIRTQNQYVKIAAAGGINLDNVKEYAATGIDIIVSSFPNNCSPSLFRVEIEPLND
jgi:molybdenum transport protein